MLVLLFLHSFLFYVFSENPLRAPLNIHLLCQYTFPSTAVRAPCGAGKLWEKRRSTVRELRNSLTCVWSRGFFLPRAVMTFFSHAATRTCDGSRTYAWLNVFALRCLLLLSALIVGRQRQTEAGTAKQS